MSKIWTKEDIVFDDIPSDIQLKDEYILKDELITVEDWVHEYIFDEDAGAKDNCLRLERLFR